MDNAVLAAALAKLPVGPISRDQFGDYFIYGFVLGAERGVNLCVNAYNKTEEESKKLTVRVKVLFIDKSESWTEEGKSLVTEYHTKVIGYDTLGKTIIQHEGSDLDVMKEVAKIFSTSHEAVKRIQEDVKLRLQDQKLVEGTRLTSKQCDELLESGLVKGMVLLPYSTVGFR